MVRTLFQKIGLFFCFLFSMTAFFAEKPLQDNVSSDSDDLFIQLPDGRYIPYSEPDKIAVLENSSEKAPIVRVKKSSFFEKVKNFFITPINCSIPLLGNMKRLYYYWEYHAVLAGQELYDACFSSSNFTSKEQVVALAKAYFFNFIGKWLTPSGTSDLIVAFALNSQLPMIANQYKLSDRGTFFVKYAMYSLYTIVTKKIDLKWYIAAFFYHVGLRPEVGRFVKVGGYAEMILLALCAPKMVHYLA